MRPTSEEYVYFHPERGNVRLMDHTGDVGFHVKASSLALLFEVSMLGIFAYMGTPVSSGLAHEVNFSVGPFPDVEMHFTEFLNNALLLASTHHKCVTGLRWHLFTQTSSQGVLVLAPWSKVFKDIKAVTYHDLALFHNGAEWEAYFIVDV